MPEIERLPADQVIVKKRYSAVFGTDLDARISEFRPDVLVIAGVNTHACVRMTAIDAYQRDYDVIVAAECVASSAMSGRSPSISRSMKFIEPMMRISWPPN